MLVFEIAGGILLAALVLAAVRNPLKASIYGLTALAFAVGLFLFIWACVWAWNNLLYPLQTLAVFVLIFSALWYHSYSEKKDAAKKIAKAEKETQDADFKVFLAESLERRKQREGHKNAPEL